VKPLWSDDLPRCSLQEILQSKAENREWNKKLRHRVTVLVDSRLANRICLEEYAVNRQQGNENAAECRRRQAILDNEITSRDKRWLTGPIQK
jgi:hypothetical protein